MVSNNSERSGEYLLEMSNINKSFPGVKALDNVNLKVRPHSIHALMGENGAGKSTLLKCLLGSIKKIPVAFFFREKRSISIRRKKPENGISMVHQELNLVLQRSVMDNMWLGRYPTKGMFVDQDKMYRDTKAIFDELDIDIDPRARVGTLSVSQMQMIEIAKAFSYDAKIVIMDEPTSSLTEKEVNHLFKIIRKLKDRGCGIVYISHKMEEIFQLCDEITILRDGQWIATQPLEGLDMDKIIAMMVGRSLNQRFPDRENTPGEVILRAQSHRCASPPFAMSPLTCIRAKFSVSPAWWALNAPTSWRPCSASVRRPAAPSRCTARRSTTTAPTRRLTTVLRW